MPDLLRTLACSTNNNANTNSTVGDDHSNMSFENYVKWLNEKLLPNRSVIVLDNASYHNAREENLPTIASKKSEMEEWLTSKGIHFDVNLSYTI